MRPTSRSARGFTLLELLVALAILALMMTGAPRLYAAAFPAAHLRASTEDLASGMRQARQSAIETGRPVPFVVDLGAGTYHVGTGRPKPLPANIGVEVLAAQEHLVGGDAAHILFFPDGGATGGSVRLKGAGQSTEITVNWLTGRVTVHD